MSGLPASEQKRTLAQKVPFFYGWVIVAAMFLAGMASSGPTQWAFQVFVVPMTEDLGWSRATMFGAMTARMLLMAVLSIFIGRLADTLKRPQWFMAAGSTLFALSVVGLAFVHSKLLYFATFSLVGGIGMAMGSGVMRSAFVAKWFVRHRGMAMTIGTMGTGMGAFIYPVFAQAMIEAFGWRQAWLVMGVSSFLLLVPIAFLVYRQPEDVGLLPDGDTPQQIAARRHTASNDAERKDAHSERSYTVRETLNTRVVWLLVAAAVLAGPSMSGLTSSWAPRFRDVGVAAGAAAAAVSIYGAFSFFFRFGWGFLSERVHIRKLIIFQMLAISASIVFLLNVHSAPMAMVYGAVQGIFFGGYVGMNPLIYPTYFGRKNIGAIQGVLMPFSTVSSALGPLLVSWVYDARGSYNEAYVALAISWVVAAGFMYLAKPRL